MVFDFSAVGLAKADDMNFVMPRCEDHYMKPPMNESKRLKVTFTVIPACVFFDQCRTPVQVKHQRERQASLHFIAVTFVWIKADILIHLLWPQ
jgi:hypothetical protein